ncbi:CHAT domain-containing protein [Aquimarina spongiae]|uniref:CHAT domain-containing protein n=1 Tax=Aquimarina spongiae TaxID=570521 RepID=A0A1M6E5C1_9FLAO|nr:CHAT domain-containing tetratricopeptide repeat protein [Aquimarina spongiae]SHI80605.1 CHAT domain-containing protein [Aquimarina spongiae]
MILKPPVILIIFSSVFFVNAQTNNDPRDSFFEKQYSSINRNITNGLYKKNTELIEMLTLDPEYQQLDCYYQGKILHKIGVSYYLLNQEANAITYFKEKLLPLWENCPQVPATERANTIYNTGVCYQYLNDLSSAKKYLDQALYIFENDSLYPSQKLAKKYHGVGKFYKDLNDIFRAELYYKNSLNLYKKLGDNKVKEFEVINNLIALHMEFKEFEKSKKYIEEALVIHDSFPDVIPELTLAWVYLNAGTTYLELKDFNSAKTMVKAAINLLDKDQDAFYYAIALELLGMIHLEQREFDVSEEYLNKVLELRKESVLKGNPKQSIVYSYENLCELMIDKKDTIRAQQYLSKAFEILIPVGHFDKDNLPIINSSKALDDEHLIRLIEIKAKIFKQQYQVSNDISFLKKALNVQHKIDSVINRSLVSFQFGQSKLDFLNLKFEHYGKAIEDALELYQITKDGFYLDEAYYFSSKTKAIVLQYELSQTDAFQSNVSEEVLQKEKSLREKMNMHQASLLETTNKQDSLLKAYTKAQYELDAFLSEIEEKEPNYFKEKYAYIRAPRIKEIQKNLPEDMVVVEYFVSKNILYSFWLTQDSFFPVTTPYDPELKDAIKNFSEQCHDPSREISTSLSKMLYDKCLRRGLNKVTGDIKRICIIPDGQLHKISFEALSTTNDTQKYLIEDYVISYSYSVSLLFREHQKRQLQRYVGFGSTYSTALNQKLKARKRFFGAENLAQLTLSQEEINRGAAIFDGKVFIDKQASLPSFLSESKDADIIHLSLHGLVDTNDPERSCIIFDDHTEEFILSPQDLYSNRLQADLVLLSACHSANGKIYHGEGVQGMSKSFLLGGAHNITSSLWNASEASSLAITTAFLENVHEGKPIDRALHQSKLDYLSASEPNKRHPYYWANFILVGEVEPSETGSGSYVLWISILGALFLLIFTFRFSKKRL